MTDNPYDVLGVNENATLDEIKSAYRNLLIKYDEVTNSELINRINNAYDEIVISRKSGNQKTQSSTSFNDVRNLIHSDRITDAQQILDGIPAEKRTAEWYFLKGTVFMKRGWLDQARSSFEKASQMEPSNEEYRSAVEYMSRRSSGESGGYNTRRGGSGSGCGGNCCDTCCALWCADSCCECFGGDFITCC